MIRQPVVAGSFYPAEPERLRQELEQFLRSDAAPSPAKAIIVPHAGYIYSGAVAGEVIAATQIPKTVILLGPNHQGTGHDIAVTGADSWSTPLGEVPIASRLRDQFCQEIADLVIDERAHQSEHSLEVMLPFLLRCQPELQIVPLSLRSLSFATAVQLGASLAKLLMPQQENVLLLASSDMNHFLDAETTQQLDSMAIAAMTELNPQALYQTVTNNRISMCGMLPAVVVMQAAMEMGATRCRLVRYAHSGMVNGDNRRVVGYAALKID
ncbi:MAG: AmmeMemoRadiSam system protein B [Deltaproteobacteria bacterium]|nr:AmmeMemoRadiSam system protein B [Deltaproteobacteria bacterium]